MKWKKHKQEKTEQKAVASCASQKVEKTQIGPRKLLLPSPFPSLFPFFVVVSLRLSLSPLTVR